MSLVKNNTVTTDSHMTIRVFPLNERIPINNSSNYKALEYVSLNGQRLNNAYGDVWYPGAGESVFIKCEFDSAAEGFFYGTISNSNGISIKKEGNYIKWYNGATMVKSVALTAGVHIIGLISTEEEKSHPFMDGVTYDDVTFNLAHHNLSVAIGCQETYTNSASYSYITSTNTWAMRVYEVLAYSYSFDTYSIKARRWFHLYAACAINETSYVGMLETRYMYRFMAITPSTPALTHGGPVQYGVQLHDIKDITGSRYRDLFAIAAEDNEIGALSNADNPSLLSKTGESHKFAFYLGLSSGSHVPIPSGYTLSKQGSTSYEVGELIKGRTPLWSIWNDAIKFGKWGDRAQLGVITYARFNLLKENTGQSSGQVKLENFKDYDTSKNYPPSFDFNEKVQMEYHNGVACKLTFADRLCGATNPNYAYTGGDERCVFPFNRESGGIGIVKLGNLPLWNYSEEEQGYAITHQTGLEKLWAIGGGLLLKIYDPSQTNPWVTFATMMKTVMDLSTPDTYEEGGETWPMPFSTDSSQLSVDTFKKNGFDCSSILRNDLVEQMKDTLSEVCVRDLLVSLMLTSSTNKTPYDSQLIDCSKLIPNKEGEVVGLFDSRMSYNDYYYANHNEDLASGDRFVMGEQGGVAKIGSTEFIIGVQADGRSATWGQFNQNCSGAAFYGKCICIGFGLKNKNSETLRTILDDGVSDVIAFMEATESGLNKGTVTTEDIDTYDTQAITPIAVGEVIRCVAVYASEPSRDNLVTSYTKEASGTTDIYKFYCSGTAGEGKFRVKMNITTTTKVQIDIEFGLYTYDVTDANPVLTINVPMSGNATITGSVYDAKCDIRVMKGWSRWIRNKYYGFSKVFPAENTSDYDYPYAYNPNFNSTKVQPFNIYGSRTSTIGSVLFMWRDLLGTRSSDTVRPTDTVGGYANARPTTFHMRVFSKATGPHCWNVMRNNYDFDTMCEIPFKSTGNEMNPIKRIYYHNSGELIEHQGQIYNHVDALISLWPSMSGSYYVPSDQITAPDSLNGKSILIYEEPLHEPKDQWDFDKDNNNDAIPLVRFDISGLSSSKKTDTFNGKVPSGSSWTADNTYQCRVTAEVVWGDYTRKPTGNVRHGEMGQDGFFRIEVWNVADGKKAKSGSIYYIDIINTPT